MPFTQQKVVYFFKHISLPRYSFSRVCVFTFNAILYKFNCLKVFNFSNILVVIATLIEMAIEHPEERVVLAGTSNLARANQDLSSSIHPILEALEEQVVLLRLLSGTDSSVRVQIGDEQSEKSLRKTSLVSVGYADIGALGILGPTRMDYAASITAVNAVANYVGRFLTENK